MGRILSPKTEFSNFLKKLDYYYALCSLIMKMTMISLLLVKRAVLEISGSEFLVQKFSESFR